MKKSREEMIKKYEAKLEAMRPDLESAREASGKGIIGPMLEALLLEEINLQVKILKQKGAILKEKAQEMGKLAFVNGIRCAPICDKEFMAFVQSIESQEVYPSLFSTVPLMKAWADGYTAANLAEPIPGITG
jgi:hypothetical protein